MQMGRGRGVSSKSQRLAIHPFSHLLVINLGKNLTPANLQPQLARFWSRSAECIDAIERTCPPDGPSPVFTKAGRYTAQGWTEWTQGFQFGSALLQFDATGEERFLHL